MVYKKKRATKKPYKKPMRYQVADMAFKAYKGVKHIKQLINTETKWYDRSVATTSIDDASTVWTLCNMAAGTGPNDRVGDSIKPQGYSFSAIVKNDTGMQNGQGIRLIFFRMHNENSVLPTYADLLLSTATTKINNHFNKTDRNRFTIIKDIKRFWSNDKTSEVSMFQISVSFKVPGHIKYVSGTASCEHNGLYLLAMSTHGTASLYKPTIEFVSRLTYTDN